jgi:hypothetical protein
VLVGTPGGSWTPHAGRFGRSRPARGRAESEGDGSACRLVSLCPLITLSGRHPDGAVHTEPEPPGQTENNISTTVGRVASVSDWRRELGRPPKREFGR